MLTREIPTLPVKIPFPPTEDNVQKLENYLKEAFSSSAFNHQPPFPVMANTLPAKIHLKKDAIPDIKYVPIPIALNWHDVIKKS